MYKITIITGNIRSGKTTFLTNHIKTLKHVGGILQPTEKERRLFVDIESQESKSITTSQQSDTTFRIGNFLFDNKAFTWAKEKLEQTLQGEINTIIIDEYGPLEFKNKGLEPVVSKIMKLLQQKKLGKLIIVIRNKLVDDFLQKFNLNLKEVEIIRIGNKSNLTRILQ